MSARYLLRSLCDPHSDLLERAEAYLTAVDLWASRGNEQTLREAVGVGKLAVVAALAAQNIGHATHPEAHFRSQSGMAPQAFQTALELLRPTVTAPPRTPSKRRESTNPWGSGRSARSSSSSFLESGDDERASASRSSRRTIVPPNLGLPRPLIPVEKRSSGSSPAGRASTDAAALKQRAMAVQSGAAFGLNRTPSSSAASRIAGSASAASSPAGRRLHNGSPASSRTPASPSTPSHRRSSLAGRSSQLSSPRSASGSTPKSVRFESHADAAATPRSQHPYTPSKRSRLAYDDESEDEFYGTGDPDSAGGTPSGKRLAAASSLTPAKRRSIDVTPGTAGRKQRERRSEAARKAAEREAAARSRLAAMIGALNPVLRAHTRLASDMGIHLDQADADSGSFESAQPLRYLYGEAAAMRVQSSLDNWLDTWSPWLSGRSDRSTAATVSKAIIEDRVE